LIDRAPVTPLDPIAHRAAVAHSVGQGRRPVFRITDTSSDDARPENFSRRRSLALGRCEHDGRLMAIRDGGAYAVVRAIRTMLVAGLIVTVLPSCASAGETVAYVAKIAPMIGGKVTIAPSAGRRSRSSWSRAPLFAGRSTGHAQNDQSTDDRSSVGAAVVDLSALVPPSDGLFLRRPETAEQRR